MAKHTEVAKVAEAAEATVTHALTTIDGATGEVIPHRSDAHSSVGNVVTRGGRSVRVVEVVSRPTLKLDDTLDSQEFFITFEGAPVKRKSKEGGDLFIVNVIDHDAQDTPCEMVLGTVFRNKLAERFGRDDAGDATLADAIGKSFIVRKYKSAMKEGGKRQYSKYDFVQVELV